MRCLFPKIILSRSWSQRTAKHWKCFRVKSSIEHVLRSSTQWSSMLRLSRLMRRYGDSSLKVFVFSFLSIREGGKLVVHMVCVPCHRRNLVILYKHNRFYFYDCYVIAMHRMRPQTIRNGNIHCVCVCCSANRPTEPDFRQIRKE